MTLHETVENIKKIGLGAGVGIVCLIIFIILIRIGIVMKNILFPPEVKKPTMAYGNLPPIDFPKNNLNKEYNYSISTDTGDLPTDLPDRLNVFPIVELQADVQALDKAKRMVQAAGFVDIAGKLVQEQARTESQYEWAYTNPDSGVTRHILLNDKTYNFTLTSDYLTKLVVLSSNLSDQKGAYATVQKLLDKMALFPTDDIDSDKTINPDPTKKYLASPESRLFDIESAAGAGKLTPVDALANVKAIRIDLYQKDVEYELNTGRSDAQNQITKRKIEYPILYPNPPYSTMNFIVASGRDEPEVYAGEFFYQRYMMPTDIDPTYYIKPPEQAYKELEDGKAYIAAYAGDKIDIQITKVYLAYYLGDKLQKYLMPIYVFEGNSGFFAYVSAVSEEFIDYTLK